MKWPEHGGHPSKLQRQMGSGDMEEITDFSANIHPFGPPGWIRKTVMESLGNIDKYPDPDYEKAREKLAGINGITAEEVLVTNGGAEAVFLAAKYFEGGQALIVQPTFTEYERACEHYHVAVEHVYFEVENDFRFPVEDVAHLLPCADVVFVCRPNNPSGTVIPEQEVRMLLERAEETGTYLVIDEAFADFMPGDETDLTGLLAEYDRLILLRSLTKMYAVPGLRAGYMLAAPGIVSVLRQWQMPWSVNSMAEALILNLPEYDQFVAWSKDYFRKERERITSGLRQLGYVVYPSSANFFLLKDGDACEQSDDLFEFLLSGGIAPRHTHNFKGLNGDYLRFAVKSEEDNDRLLGALMDWRRKP